MADCLLFATVQQLDTASVVGAECWFKFNLIQRSENNAMLINISLVYPRSVSGILTSQSCKILIGASHLK